MADDCHPRERALFLGRIRDALGGEDSKGGSGTDPSDWAIDLDAVIQELRQAIVAAKWEAEMTPPFPDEDEDTLGPFADVIPLVDSTLERIGNELEHGRAECARAGYEQVWELIDFEDEFGRAPRLEEEDPERAREHAARYLRSVYLATNTEDRPMALCEAAERVRFVGFSGQPSTLYITLREIAEASRATLPAWDTTLHQLLSALEGRFDPLGDLWLRAATQERHGIDGLAALAYRDGIKRPLAWLDAVGMAIQQRDAARAIEIERAAAECFPPRAQIRAELADLVAHAVDPADETLLARLRYDAFLTDPTTDRLLALWQALGNADDQAAWLVRAVEHLTANGSRGDESLRPQCGTPGAELTGPSLSQKYTNGPAAALAALLAGQWDRARTLAEEADSLGWSRGTNAQSVVFISALMALSSADGAEPGPMTTELWSATVAAGAWQRADVTTTYALPNGERVPQRDQFGTETLAQGYRVALAQSLAQRPLSAKETETWLAWCMEAAAARCDGIVGNQHRRAYPRAAGVVAACYETACARSQPRAGEQFLQRIRSLYPRHSAFQRALREAINRST
ncbi:hypothetical protein CKO15_06280 [Halorhodospira abdelmalekii]|uniref:hypothetical protein n=1 Tax=Halorhodospira abdelmalekii TaxID=421629 RepID=UPI0019078044|nr:hypothetical protein [Halorhodospira abdelmalekii]MBK1734900.1 hypothetical protein [Halorhodospira abdelmalekii]